MNGGYYISFALIVKLKQKVKDNKTKGIMSFKSAEPQDRVESMALDMNCTKKKELLVLKLELRI